MAYRKNGNAMKYNDIDNNSNPVDSFDTCDPDDDNMYRLNIWKFALIGLLVSISVISVKLYNQHDVTNFSQKLDEQKEYLQKFLENFPQYIQDFKENSPEYIEKYSEYYNATKENVIKSSSIWLPIFCGVIMTYLTGMVVYLDSAVPGVYPPSPLSPSKNKKIGKSKLEVHSNYFIAGLIGVLTSSYLFYRGVSL